MTRDGALLLLLVVVAAVWIVVHLLLLQRTLRLTGLSRGARMLAVVPPLTVIIAWRAGARGYCVLWAVVGSVYGVLRSLA